MPITLEMQPLTTVTVAMGGTQIQSESDYVDVGGWQDLVILVFFQANGTIGTTGTPLPGFYIDNGAVKEELMFTSTQLATVNSGTGPTQGQWTSFGPYHLGYSTGISPPTFLRYLRWRIVAGGSASSTWTFRILLSGNPAPR
jgi:hypothetical protein